MKNLGMLLICLYVDDLLITCNTIVKISKKKIMTAFKIIDLVINHVLHGRSKHFESMFHFLSELVNKEMFKVVHYSTEKQLIDLFTKENSIDTFKRLKKEISVVPLNNLNQGMMLTCSSIYFASNSSYLIKEVRTN